MGSALDFLISDKKDGKPRESGLTIVHDQSTNLDMLAARLTSAEPYIDCVRLDDIFPGSTPKAQLFERIRLFEKHNIKTFFAPELFLWAALNDQAREYIDYIGDLGMTAIAITSNEHTMPLATVLSFVEECRLAGFFVYVGSAAINFEGRGMVAIARDIERWISAGASKVAIGNDMISFCTASRHLSHDFELMELSDSVDPNGLVFDATTEWQLRKLFTLFGNQLSVGPSLDLGDVSWVVSARACSWDIFHWELPSTSG